MVSIRMEVQIVLVVVFLVVIGIVAYHPDLKTFANMTGFVAYEGGGKQRVIVILKNTTTEESNLITGNVAGAAKEKAIEPKEAKKKVLDDVNKKGLLSPASDDIEEKQELDELPAMVVEATEQGIEKLKAHPLVQEVIVDFPLTLYLQDSVPLTNASFVHAQNVSGTMLDGDGGAVCIVDTGIQADHPAFAGRVVNEKCYCQGCCEGGADEGSTAPDTHGQSHGTHVAGIVAGGAPLPGMAPGADIVAVKVCGSSCMLGDLLSGMNYCVSNKDTYDIKVMTASIGDSGEYSTQGSCPTYLDSAIDAAHAVDIITTIASGNDGHTDGISYPGCSANAIAVGATNDADGMMSWSNRGALLEMLAPGNNINSTKKTDAYGFLGGTSMSTPHVAGAAAVLKQYAELAGVNDSASFIRAALLNSSVLVGSWPRLDLARALMHMGWTPTQSNESNESEDNQVTSSLSIVVPMNNSVITAKDAVFRANLSNLANATIAWSSNISGSLGLGVNITVNLSIGNQTVTANASNGTHSVAAAVRVRAVPATVCSIDLDLNGDTFVDVGDIVALAQLENVSCVAPQSPSCLVELNDSNITSTVLQDMLDDVVARNVTDVYGVSCTSSE